MKTHKITKYFTVAVITMFASLAAFTTTTHAYTSVPADISSDTLIDMNENLEKMEKNIKDIYDIYEISEKEQEKLKEKSEDLYVGKLDYFIEFRDDHMDYVEWCTKRIKNIKEQVVKAQDDEEYRTEEWSYIQDEYKQTVNSYNYVDRCADILLNEYYEKIKTDINERKQMKQLVKKMKKKIPVKKTDSIKVKVKKINTYICNNYKYNSKYKEKSFLMCVKTKKMVCWGYSRLFKQLCTEYGIDVAYCQGYRKDGSSGHAWNIVKDEKNKQYYVDTTWNDATGTKTYLWLSKKKFMKTHGKYSEGLFVDWK